MGMEMLLSLGVHVSIFAIKRTVVDHLVRDFAVSRNPKLVYSHLETLQFTSRG